MTRKNAMRATTILSLLLATSLVACSDDDDGPGQPEVPFTVNSLTVSGSTSEAATVTIEQQTDQDAAADTSWSATYDLDGGTRAASLPEDSNSEQVFEMVVKSTPTAGGAVERKRVTITLR